MFKKFLPLLLLITASLSLLSAFTTVSASEGWMVKSVDSSNLSLNVHYKVSFYKPSGCLKCADQAIGTHMSVVLRSPYIPSSASVRMVFLNSQEANPNYGQTGIVKQDVYEIDLTYSPEQLAFVGYLPDMVLLETGYPGTWKFHQEFAVVSNGDWFKDPWNGGNFWLQLYGQAGY